MGPPWTFFAAAGAALALFGLATMTLPAGPVTTGLLVLAVLLAGLGIGVAFIHRSAASRPQPNEAPPPGRPVPAWTFPACFLAGLLAAAGAIVAEDATPIADDPDYSSSELVPWQVAGAAAASTVVLAFARIRAPPLIVLGVVLSLVGVGVVLTSWMLAGS